MVIRLNAQVNGSAMNRLPSSQRRSAWEGIRRAYKSIMPNVTAIRVRDVLETGMFLSGGGSLLRGLDLRLAQEAEVPVHLTDRPLEATVLGAGTMLERLEDYGVGFQFVRRRSLRG